MTEDQKKEGIKAVAAPAETPEPIDENELIKRVQVILYASGRAMGVDELISMTKEQSARNIKKAIAELTKQMEERESPLMIVEEKPDHWKFAIKDDYLVFVAELIPNMDLDKATLETLAVIAWRHPILQADVIKIRTSNAYEHIAKLVDIGFVSKERYGRSFVLKPTSRFFEYFDLPSKEYIKDLFKNVTDSVRVIDEKKEDQKQVEEFAPEKVGDMPVYETTQEPKEKQSEEEPEMHLGQLEVYEEGKEEEKTEKEGVEIAGKREVNFDDLNEETVEETEEAEQPEESPTGKTEEDKAMEVINGIAAMDDTKEAEETEEDEGAEGVEKTETEESEPAEEASQEHELSPALEAFASDGEEKPKPAEEPAEKPEEPSGEADESKSEEPTTEKPDEQNIDDMAEEK